MKICVYAIAKNEEQFVERFCNSARHADVILIADTGSTDGTVARSEDCGAIVQSISISPFRFDHARNAALAMVPADIDVCVSLDLDEVLEDGWREEVERMWTDGVTQIRYQYEWKPNVKFSIGKIHARHGYQWKHPAHEVLYSYGIKEKSATTDKLLVSHHADDTKSRGFYLDLLKLGVEESPNCHRSNFYYARELFFNGRYRDAVSYFDWYLSLPDATWKCERSFAYRTIGKCYENLGEHGWAESFYHKSCAETPDLRDAWLYLARYYHNRNCWAECYGAIARLFRITEKPDDHTARDDAWNYEPHDLAALAAWRIGLKNEAIKHGHEALRLKPDDQRLLENVKWYIGETRLEAAE